MRLFVWAYIWYQRNWKNGNGTWPGADAIARDLGAGSSYVARILRELESKGYVKAQLRGRGASQDPHRSLAHRRTTARHRNENQRNRVPTGLYF